MLTPTAPRPARASPPTPERVLVIDDDPALLEDYRRVLLPDAAADQARRRLLELEREMLGREPAEPETPRFEVDFAVQGQEGLELLRAGLAAGRPHALAFVDMRMPPGWDGVETVRRLWREAPDLEVVFVTAYSHHRWAEIRRDLPCAHQFLILKKPFEAVEVVQLAASLTAKGRLRRLADEDSQRRIRQAEKLQALGRMAAAIAHEINNPLSYLMANLELVREALAAAPGRTLDLPDCLAMLGDAALGAARIAKIVADVKGYARAQEAGGEPVDPRTLCEAALRLQPAERCRRIGLIVDGSGEGPEGQLLPPVQGDRARLEQVLSNLLENADHALEGLHGRDGQIILRLGPAPGGVSIAVEDNGCGIAPADLPRVLEPFYTTKGPRRGLGLGLAICHEILSAMGSGLEIDSRPGEGTRMRFVLRAAAAAGRS